MSWTWSEIAPGTASSTRAVRDIVFANATVCVAIGDRDAGSTTCLLYRSTDAGASFSLITAPEFNSWRGLAYAPPSSGIGTGSGRYFAVASGGTHRGMYSDDLGATWTLITTPSVAGWQSVAYDPVNKWFIAVASSSGGGVSRVMTGDGASMTSRSASAVKSWTFVCCNGTVAVAAHVSGGTDCVMTSTDGGLTWASQTTPNWTTVGGPSSGSSGIAWSTTAGIFAMIVQRASDSKFRVATATAGVTWTEQTIPDINNRPGSIVRAEGVSLFVMFDQAGTNRVNTSADAVTWTDEDETFHRFWDCAGWGEAAQVVLCWNQNTNGTFLRGVWVGALAISPATGFTSGGLSVTIAGGPIPFVSGTTVAFGTYYGQFVPATNVVVVNSTTITCTTPAYPTAGLVTVLVTVPSNNPEGILNGFTYVAPSTTAGGSGSFSLSPNNGPVAGGTVVTITAVGGYTFGASPRVFFDDQAATSVTGGGTGTLTCHAPAHVLGAVNVVVYDS